MGIAFGNNSSPDVDKINSSLNIDKIVGFLSETYEVPRPRWIMGETYGSHFTPPNLLVIGSIPDEPLFRTCNHVLHEFAHYFFYWSTRLKYVTRIGTLDNHARERQVIEDYAWDRMERCLVDGHTIVHDEYHPLLAGEEAFAESFGEALGRVFEQLKPEYKKMFGLFPLSPIF